MSREQMKVEALEALVHIPEKKQSMAKMLASWMRNRHGVEQDEDKISVLIEFVVRDASDFSPLLTDVLTGLVAMLDGAEHRICDMEQEQGALLIERDAMRVDFGRLKVESGYLRIERDNLRTLMGVGGPAVQPGDVADAALGSHDVNENGDCRVCRMAVDAKSPPCPGNPISTPLSPVRAAMAKEREDISSGRGERSR